MFKKINLKDIRYISHENINLINLCGKPILIYLFTDNAKKPSILTIPDSGIRFDMEKCCPKVEESYTGQLKFYTVKDNTDPVFIKQGDKEMPITLIQALFSFSENIKTKNNEDSTTVFIFPSKDIVEGLYSVIPNTAYPFGIDSNGVYDGLKFVDSIIKE